MKNENRNVEEGNIIRGVKVNKSWQNKWFSSINKYLHEIIIKKNLEEDGKI